MSTLGDIIFDGEDGTRLRFSAFDVEPYSFVELRSLRATDPFSLPLKLRKAKAVDQFGRQFPESSVVFPFEGCSRASKMMGIVLGGCIPALWAARNHLLLLDRNAISEIQGAYCDGVRRSAVGADFFDLISDCAIRINHVSWALEGNVGRVPTDDEIAAQLAEARVKLQAALPKAKLQPPDSAGLAAARGILKEESTMMSAEIEFLRKSVPIAKAARASARASYVFSEILDIASSLPLQRSGLTILLVIAYLLGPCSKEENPAVKVVNWRGENYDSAYNTYCDIRLLRFLLIFQCNSPDEHFSILTADRGLALFWSALGIDSVKEKDGYPSFDISLDSTLFPMSDKQWSSLTEMVWS